MCSAIRCRSCVPQAPGTPHSRAYTHIVLHQNTHTLTQRHPHRGMHDHVQTHYLLPCSPTYPQRLPQEQSGCGQGGGKQSGAPLPLRPLPHNPIKYQDLVWPSRPTPAHLLQEAFLPYAQPSTAPQHSPPYHLSGFLNGTASRPGVT